MEKYDRDSFSKFLNSLKIKNESVVFLKHLVSGKATMFNLPKNMEDVAWVLKAAYNKYKLMPIFVAIDDVMNTLELINTPQPQQNKISELSNQLNNINEEYVRFLRGISFGNIGSKKEKYRDIYLQLKKDFENDLNDFSQKIQDVSKKQVIQDIISNNLVSNYRAFNKFQIFNMDDSMKSFCNDIFTEISEKIENSEGNIINYIKGRLLFFSSNISLVDSYDLIETNKDGKIDVLNMGSFNIAYIYMMAYTLGLIFRRVS